MNRPLAGLFLPLLLLIVAGCSPAGHAPGATPAGSPPPFADCRALIRPPGNPPGSATPGSASAGAPSAGSAAPAGSHGPVPAGSPAPLPDLRLPCFVGTEPVALSALRGPAVINLWASWCAPCRKELPAFERLARRADGRLQVVGVDTRDDRAAAQSLAEDLGLTFPTLYDRDEQLRRKLARNALPVTLFVDGDGRIRHIDNTGALDDSALVELVERQLGVSVR